MSYLVVVDRAVVDTKSGVGTILRRSRISVTSEIITITKHIITIQVRKLVVGMPDNIVGAKIDGCIRVDARAINGVLACKALKVTAWDEGCYFIESIKICNCFFKKNIS